MRPDPLIIDRLWLAIDHLKDANNKAFDAGNIADSCGLKTQNFYLLRIEIKSRIEALKAEIEKLKRGEPV